MDSKAKNAPEVHFPGKGGGGGWREGGTGVRDMALPCPLREI